ncbi:MAG: SRPBCC family protein [Chloroflexi bacterium]|nr:SRPBCC family protein [Chloroflexota bacterium]
MVWAALTDVEGWPNWTASMTSVQRLDAGELALGSQARIRQPRLPELVWTVTGLDYQRSFTWEARSAGLVTAGEHAIALVGAGKVQLTLRVRHTGRLSGLVGLLTGRQTQRYMAMEAEGFKRCCEGTGAVAAA